jgi:hypothetical protein
MIVVKRVLIGNDHDDAKWIVLEGSVEGTPQVTKRRTINTAALVSGATTLADEKAALIADVTEYLARYQTIQEALKSLQL